ncbi:CobW/HypB/UreG, nucleotide-binding domain-containing protein [Lipomyces kononenkoae]|uniref:CobW/HypB/UreG, nucleotide-binding domain-containing protein n=1 Tax=Lipomyces kononenkoae TaxID=34357 RepID=A0ACC3T3F6_LIPKO
MTVEPTPVTVFTGFLGAGKTTLLISLLQQLPKDYRVAILKNEYGDISIDSALAAQNSSNIAGVKEMLNGCLCCVLTGQMRAAIVEIQENYRPDRILIETSGSAFPATISIQLRDLAKEFSDQASGPGIRLDGVVNVIDVENFTGYADTSKTAALQAQYTDLIVFNKWENVSERQFDIVWDRVNDLNTDTPKIKSNNGTIPLEAILGIDSRLGLAMLETPKHEHEHDCAGHDHEEHVSEIETLTVTFPKKDLDGKELSSFLNYIKTAPKDEIYRMKFILRLPSCALPTASKSDDSSEPRTYILNWAFGRYEFTLISDEAALALLDDNLAGIGTVMVGRGEGRRFRKRLSNGVLGDGVSVELLG